MKGDQEVAPTGLSVVIIARDAEVVLSGCLASVAWADEIVVVDSGSVDGTVALAEAAGARIIRQPFLGYGPQKNVGVDAARGEWILNVDADERVTPELAEEIRRVIEEAGHPVPPGGAGSPTPVGYAIPFDVRFLGGRLRFGGVGGERHLRLFRKTAGRFSDAPIHEAVAVAGRVGRLRGRMIHESYRTLEEYWHKLDRYTRTDAERWRAAGRRFAWWKLARIPLEFLHRAVLKLGVLDGRRGIIWAGLCAWAVLVKYARLRDLELAA